MDEQMYVKAAMFDRLIAADTALCRVQTAAQQKISELEAKIKALTPPEPEQPKE